MLYACMAAKFDQNMLIAIRPYIRRLSTASSLAYAESGDLVTFQLSRHLLPQQTHVVPQVGMLEINSQLKQLVKTGHLRDARDMFDKLPQRDEITWTSIISGYVSSHDSSEALSLLSRMWVEPFLRMDPFILSLALKACAHNLNVKHGESLHGYCAKTGFVNSVFVGSALLDMYMKTGKTAEGCRVFDEMPVRNAVSWTAIITGLVRAGYNEEGLNYFSEMWRAGVEYDSYTFAIALKACADTGLLRHGREIHTQTIKRGVDVSSFVANTLATMYNKCGKLHCGLHLFEKMWIRDVVSWTTIITTYVQMGQGEHAIQAFLRMRETDVSPNEYTFAAVVSGCANVARIEWGEQLHAHVLHIGLLDSLSVANSIMSMYSRCGQLKSAAMVFHEMSRRDVVSWSTVIAAYAQGGCGVEAFEFLSRMRRGGPKPTEFALASVLSACGTMAILEQGKQLHAHVLSIGLDHTASIQSALINMYAKCGSIREASKIFDVVENMDTVSWTAMINGYAEHGSSHDAINLFEKLLKLGLRPDSVTFIGVLCACSHAGLVDRGFHYFKLMSKEYDINPSKEHYGCMIDLLCRAGRLGEAEDMIRNMPSEQDDVVWSTLLRACREQGDVECGRRTAEQILKLNPYCAGTHITLANIYSAEGRWREAADVRMLMKSKGVMKEPGWSSIEVEDRVSTFVASAQSHPQCEAIYRILELLALGEKFAVNELDALQRGAED
ncbi:hypothetical protein RJ640_018280 [Escallonia rubra]|uniref:Pentatricopeptide repeat-containing protein n=1 Tax=Escallonia rubra TaxID=112253 RepID=A0AA88QGX9_9ASTE|nr:hypothetical protein RJ640_018280 [Escallonia rubra]